MSERNETEQKTEATSSETTVHQPEVADASTSIVDAAFDVGTKAVVDVLSFTHDALKKSATALEQGAKKVDALTSALKH